MRLQRDKTSKIWISRLTYSRRRIIALEAIATIHLEGNLRGLKRG
jgi:hypothetical protein